MTVPKIMTYKRLQETLADLRDQLAIWEYLHDHVADVFVSKDNRPPKKSLRADDSIRKISEAAFEEVMEAIGTGPIKELQGKIAALEEQAMIIDVENTEEEEEQDGL